MSTKLTRRKFLGTSALAGVAATGLPHIWLKDESLYANAATGSEIDVGVLSSLTGPLEVPERSLSDAVRMAIQEINANGGVAGRMINAIVEDAASDPKTFNEKAGKLVIRDRTITTFGGYTTASRLAVRPIYEKRKNLFFFPTFYEGSECSSNIVYTGAVPNQQLYNLVPWMVNTLGKKKIFIVGSNYAFPKGMAQVAKTLLEENDAEWVADEYLELGETEWGAMVNKIKNSGCDAVLSNVVSGPSIAAFYREFKNQGITQTEIPICATVATEIEISSMGNEFAAGSYSSLPYFQAITRPENKKFVADWKEFNNDENAVTHDPQHSSYFGVYLWKQASEKVLNAGEKLTPMAIHEALRDIEFDAPGGLVKTHAENMHTYFTPRIAQWGADGQGIIVDEGETLAPLPYAISGEAEGNLYCTASGLDSSKL
ncbi:transporter substrate-binding protein [Pontibaca salina]|uniref:Transporter substrate-binding protein n=1 Tax=Pontibaca salina TaxID=2795731 RepID=A0A934HSA1_9RHOB|nr:transporter substrate-binding protein [Pontibaca salina]MBI6629946.1 transporter substrate-binding protein [Pontibaca salina]